MSVAVGELGTPGQWHIHMTAAQRVVRSNLLLMAHLGDVAGRRRVGIVCRSESAANWHHNQRWRLSETPFFVHDRRKGIRRFHEIYVGLAAPWGLRLGERRRCAKG